MFMNRHGIFTYETGGKIWIHNNFNEKGVTITFGIPLIKRRGATPENNNGQLIDNNGIPFEKFSQM